MSVKSEQEISSFKEKIKTEAEELVLKRFPRKILDLNILSNSEKFSPNSALKTLEINISIPPPKSQLKSSSVSSVNTKTNKISDKDLVIDDEELILVKPFLFPNGRVECNQQLIEMIDEVKPRMIEISEDIIVLKLAVSLMVPKIEDGNNFGVEIQQETIEALSKVQNQILNDFDRFEDYFESRGDLMVKVAKYPHNHDFRVAVEECDHKFHLNLCLILMDIRNHYMSLHDLVTKNLHKIKEPRSQDNKEFLY